MSFFGPRQPFACPRLALACRAAAAGQRLWLLPKERQDVRPFFSRLPVLLEHRGFLSLYPERAALGQCFRDHFFVRHGLGADQVCLSEPKPDLTYSNECSCVSVGRYRALYYFPFTEPFTRICVCLSAVSSLLYSAIALARVSAINDNRQE